MELEEILKHHGVKGMKWGVRRKSGSGVVSKKVGEVKTRVKSELGSLKRERSWTKQLQNMDKMSTQDINKLASRIQLENDFRRLSKTKGVGGKNVKKAYRERDKLNDRELLDKVSNLRAKDNLQRAASTASKAQVEAGKRVVGAATAVGFKYVTTGRVSTKDIGMAVLNPKPASASRKEQIQNFINNNDKVLVDRNK